MSAIASKPTVIPVAAHQIIFAVAEYYDVPLRRLLSETRTNRVARARWVAMYLLRKTTAMSLEEIGCAFARDHTTVIHGVRRTEEMIETDETLKAQIEILKDKLAPIGSRETKPRFGGGAMIINPNRIGPTE
jgi:chromosomal replication initiation ATPase DnaA